MLKKIFFIGCASLYVNIQCMDSAMYTYWGSGKYKVMEFSRGIHKIIPDISDTVIYNSSDFIFYNNDIIFKVCILKNKKNYDEMCIPQKRYLTLNLTTGNDNEWQEHRSCTNWEGCKNGLKKSSIHNDSYQINSMHQTLIMQGSPYYMVHTQNHGTIFCASMIHSTKNIMLCKTKQQGSLFTSWNLFYAQSPCYGATYLTPLFAHKLGDISDLDDQPLDTACFSPDGTMFFVFLTNGTIFKVVPEQPIRVTPKAYDIFFRWS